MLSLIARVMTHIGEANDRKKLTDVIQAAVKRLGFDSFNLSCRNQDPRKFIHGSTLTNWPEEKMTEYIDHVAIDRDPLMAHASVPGPPKIWSIREWQSPQFFDYAHFLATRGVRSGVTARLTRTPGVASVITAVSSAEEPVGDEVATAVYVIGQAGLIRLMALEVADPATEPPNPHLADLSADQIEILEWARQGKSNGDIALITGRSKRTVAYHMSEILKKLGVSTRAQAVALYSGNRAAPP